jgi:hypothetical protein
MSEIGDGIIHEAEQEQRANDRLTFDYALERMREALERAEAHAYNAQHDRSRAFSGLAQAWGAFADVLDTRDVRERDAREEAEWERQKQERAASKGLTNYPTIDLHEKLVAAEAELKRREERAD